MEIPLASAVEKGDFADAKFYKIAGKPGLFRRLVKPAADSVVAVYDEPTLKTQHFTQVECAGCKPVTTE
jgi:hypothetical protein